MKLHKTILISIIVLYQIQCINEEPQDVQNVGSITIR